MKRKLTCGVMAAVLLSMMAGCTHKGSGGAAGEGNPAPIGADDQITLSYWHYEDETTVSMLAEKFMEIHPNIKVECRLINDMSTDLSAAAAAGDFPDVFSGTDSDTALSNQYWMDMSEYFNNDPETKDLMPSINEYGIGCFDTSARYAIPTWYRPSAIFIDRNVIEHLNLEMPRTDWTWDEMIQLIKDATKDERTGMKYYGLGYYMRLDSLYGIAACSPEERKIKGEFGFDGEGFDLRYWAKGEQEFSDLKVSGYVAPQQDTQAMEDWSGDWGTWFGATGHVAVFSEGYWSYMNIWGQEGYQEQYGLDIVPYVTPNVVDEKEHNVIAEMYMGGISSSCKHPAEAYELLKFMTWSKEGWKVRLEIYNDPTITNASGVPLKNANMPVPMTLDSEIWDGYKALFPTDPDHKPYWDAYFDSIKHPVPYGWYNIAGYWNFCDQYFNKIGIHDLVDAGTAKAADYAEEATRQANYYHAEAMISYFGPTGYDILSEEELAKYQATVDSFTK